MSSIAQTSAGRIRLLLREIPCEKGWAAAVLETPFAAAADLHPDYRDAVAWLLARLHPFEGTATHDIFLQFDRMRPDVEIPLMRTNAAFWQPDIGLGVWPHEPPPTTWTKEEFIAAAPGTLRPVMYRVMHIQSDPKAQRSAWSTLLGSGALLRVATPKPGDFLESATAYFLPSITDVSLVSFPFYVPLLTTAALSRPHSTFATGLESWLPMVEGYMRESAEDGGLLIVSRQSSESLWRDLDTSEKLPFDTLPLVRADRAGTQEGQDAWR